MFSIDKAELDHEFHTDLTRRFSV